MATMAGILSDSNLIVIRQIICYNKESKEYRLAKDWEMAVNSFSFNPERFAAAIPDMHPTLQQSLYRLIKACIKAVSYTHLDVYKRQEQDCAMRHRHVPLPRRFVATDCFLRRNGKTSRIARPEKKSATLQGDSRRSGCLF